MKYFIGITSLLLSMLLFPGCKFYKIPKLLKVGEVSKSEFLETVPMNFVSKIILVDVVIEGKTYNFVLDTGAELSVIGEHIADGLEYKNILSDQVNATTKEKSADKLQFVRMPKISIGSIDFEQTGALIADISHFDRVFGCNSIDGIIGNNLMRKAAWQIDYKDEEVSISNDAKKFFVSEEAHYMAVDAGNARNVYLNISLDGVSGRYAFDTGSAGSITADSALFKTLSEKNTALKYSEETGVISLNLNGTITGTNYNVLIEEINVQGLNFSDQIISLSGSKKPLMGNGLFQNFTLTIDWDRDTLIFDPNSILESDSLSVLELGITPNYISQRFEIAKMYGKHVLENPVSFNSKILMINGENVSDFTREELCSYWEMNKQLIKYADSLDLVILDGSQTREVHLTRKTLLPY